MNILVVDDDEVDTEAVTRAFRKSHIANPIRAVRNGVEALRVLRGDGGEPPMPGPYLILLDLNMPRMNGLEFLQELRQDSQLRKSIVFVLTTSKDEQDILAAYDKNVAGYIVKSNAGEDFLSLIGMMEHYWRFVEFPPESHRKG